MDYGRVNKWLKRAGLAAVIGGIGVISTYVSSNRVQDEIMDIYQCREIGGDDPEHQITIRKEKGNLLRKLYLASAAIMLTGIAAAGTRVSRREK